MILKYSDFSLKVDILNVIKEFNSISEDENINEGALSKLLGKGSSLAGLVKQLAGGVEEFTSDPKAFISKNLGKMNVMSKSDFNKFVKSYSEVYDDLDLNFIKKHKKQFDVINDIIRTHIAKQKLEVEIATRSEKISKAEEEERLAGETAKEIIRSAREKREKLQSKTKRSTRKKK